MSDTHEQAEAWSGAPGDGKRKVSSFAEEARARLAEGIEPMKEKAKEMAEAQKASGAEKMSGVAEAVHRAADDLGRELPQAAGYIHDAAASLEQASAALKDRSLDDLMDRVGQFARKQPVAFFGAAMLAGFALSRFLKSSAEPSGEGR